jgi:hypothetical protein
MKGIMFYWLNRHSQKRSFTWTLRGVYLATPCPKGTHMPVAHRKHLNWSPERFLNWALEMRLATRDVVQHLLNLKAHHEQSYRTCLGLLALAKREIRVL